MDLTDIMSISGKPGLFKMVAKSKSSLVVESLIDKKRFPAFGSSKISSLEEIGVFTAEETIPLKDVFKRIFDKEQGVISIDSNSDGSVLRTYFEEIVPEYDKDRVYTSDMKKIISWYNILFKENMLVFEDENKIDETPKEEDVEVISKKTKKVTKKKKAEADDK